MSYMNDDCDPFGVPYAPLKVKQKKEKSNEKYTLDNEDYKNHHSRIICNDRELYLHQVVDSLNRFAEENKQLKQFQDRVFSWIDMHLQRLPILIDEEFNSDNEFADSSLYSGALQILETMKKELKGDVE